MKMLPPTMVDRVVSYFDPVRGAKRAHARAVLAMADEGYSTAGMTGPNRGWRPRARDAAADTLPHLSTLRGQSRDLGRNNPIGVGAINTNVDRTVGTGIALQAEPDRQVLNWSDQQAADWKGKLERQFSMWADSTECDITGYGNFYDNQALVLRSALESGDCFTLLPELDATSTQPYRLRLQILEADRVGNPNNAQDTGAISAGIRFDTARGAPTAAFVYDMHPGANLAQAAGKRYAGQWVEFMGRSGRRRLLHHFKKLRPGLPRGIPYLAPVIEAIKQLGRYTEAEIAAAVISSFFTVFITSASGQPAPVFTGQDPQAPAAELPAEINMGAGAVLGLAPGEKPEFADPSRPNPAFDPFVVAILQQIGMALGLPLELLIKRFNSSYSASKAALLDAWVWFRAQRTWLVRSFCQPVYETWMAEAVYTGRVEAPGFFTDPLLRWAYTRANWFGDSMGSINPKDEIEAYTTAIDHSLCTRERAEWELFGTPWGSTYPQKKRERDQLRKDDMLPTPKAGAAAPVRTQPAETA